MAESETLFAAFQLISHIDVDKTYSVIDCAFNFKVFLSKTLLHFSIKSSPIFHHNDVKIFGIEGLSCDLGKLKFLIIILKMCCADCY